MGEISGIRAYLSPYKSDEDSIREEFSPSPQPFELSNSLTSNSGNKISNNQTTNININKN